MVSAVYIFLIFRHPSVIPYDFNRVRINNLIDGCDYINASWIFETNPIPNVSPILKQPKVTFIAAQGPMLHSTEHFLQMLSDYKVDLVIMLTNLVENQKRDTESKCKFRIGVQVNANLIHVCGSHYNKTKLFICLFISFYFYFLRSRQNTNVTLVLDGSRRFRHIIWQYYGQYTVGRKNFIRYIYENSRTKSK